MQKAKEGIRAVAGRVLVIGFSVQILLGLLWMCSAFTKAQAFAESSVYLNAAWNFRLDEYTGALYPVVLMLVKGLEAVTGIPYRIPVFLLQLGVAFYAGYFLLKCLEIKGKIWRIWGSLALMTFPMMMQCHMAVLPYSLNVSCALLQTAFLFAAVRREKPMPAADWLPVLIFWIAEALLLPEYLYLGGVPVVLTFFYQFLKYAKENRKKQMHYLLMLMAAAGLIFGIHNLTQEEGAYGKAHRSFEAALFRRCVWTDLQDYYKAWPSHVQDLFDEGALLGIRSCADKMELQMQPLVEQALGVDGAKEWFGEAAKQAFVINSGQILHEIAWDVVGYIFPPITTELLLQGRGYDSYCARNYEVMRQNAPILTKYYMQYLYRWFPAALGIAAILQLLELTKKGKKKLFMPFVCVCFAGAIIVRYTFWGAGIWDYKKALFVGGLWLIWMVWLAAKE